ncbi:class I SAM-dependent methyltransferase [Polycladidibacter hongkongensis]|uniref:class I SAM-dependent methyltransferase n=1 Tax=Polycladidibacter hongkongensis TaxID=1647556 RepID=UPI000831B2C4|nr:class I SAM-dependent methyltransferase [Pseudovibrio hongkongensis]
MKKYDKIYQKDPDYFGHTSKQFTTTINAFDFKEGLVLDIGAGQGRDALYLAAKGHKVIAVDSCATGLEQLRERAEEKNFPIEIVHRDALGYTPPKDLDAIVLDQFFHEVPNNAKVPFLKRMMAHLRPDGYLLIADEKSVLPMLRSALKEAKWDFIRDKNGVLFALKPV